MALKISERNLKNQKSCKTDASEMMAHFHTFTWTWSAKSTTVSTCYSWDWSQRLKFLQNASTSKCFRHQQNKPLTFKNSSTKLIHLPSTSSPPPSLPKKKSGPLRTSAEILGAVLEVEASQPPEAPRHQTLMLLKSYCNSDAKTTKFPVLSIVLTCSGWWL